MIDKSSLFFKVGVACIWNLFLEMGHSTKCYCCRLWDFKLVEHINVHIRLLVDVTLYEHLYEHKVTTTRLQQPVQNQISDNTNVLWNSPSLGKSYSYRLPLV